jgi:hypothetical protein
VFRECFDGLALALVAVLVGADIGRRARAQVGDFAATRALDGLAMSSAMMPDSI